MKANDGQCLNLVSFIKQLECSCTDSPGQDASPSQVPSQQCWYSFPAEYTEANWGLQQKLPKLQKRTMPGVGIEPTTIES